MPKLSTVLRSKRKPKFSTRKTNRCFKCGRARGYIGAFDLCRICFREMVSRGEIPGIKRSSW